MHLSKKMLSFSSDKKPEKSIVFADGTKGYMMGYTTSIGKIALRYLLFRIKQDLSENQKDQGAAYFVRSYGLMFHTRMKHTRWICQQRLQNYCEELALHAYQGAQGLHEPSECFLWMSFVYVVGICGDTRFDIGSGLPDLLAAGLQSGATEGELLHLFSEVSNSLLQIPLLKQIGLQLAS